MRDGDGEELVAEGDRVVVAGRTVTVETVKGERDGAVDLIVESEEGLERLTVSRKELVDGRRPSNDGRGNPTAAIAALWARWMQWATPRIRSSVTATRPLTPYAHQDEAVFVHMLPQPRLRFLLADEPGTGKTIMAGMYLVEARRQGLVRGKTLIVPPAHLVSKWIADLRRLFGVESERLTSEVALSPRPLRPDVDVWVVSLDLFTHNPDALRKAAGEDASWSLLVFDEAHRLTPTSSYLDAAWQAARRAHHLLLLTATPHRGKEWFFRHLLHLLDPQVYAEPDKRQAEQEAGRLTPGQVHFLRRMKEQLVDNDGHRLFPPRHAETRTVELGARERDCYEAVMDYVDAWYADAATLARTIYGKRAGSSVHAAVETLQRRREALEESQQGRTDRPSPIDFDRDRRGLDDDEAWEAAEDSVVHAVSRDRRGEVAALEGVLAQLREWLAGGEPAAKWQRLQDLMANHRITPGGEQLLIFTEYADTAHWLAGLLRRAGYSVDTLSGAVGHADRDDLQDRFLRGDFQVLVSTDAGGEGIDLQSANVMVDWDIPWSLVRLEQRAGRLHRIGQHREVFIYHLVAPDTREGRVQQVVLENLDAASSALAGRIFDVLDAAVAESGFDYTRALVDAQRSPNGAEQVLPRVPSGEQLARGAQAASEQQDRLASTPDVDEALARFAADRVEAVNPVMVEGFLRQLAAADGWHVGPGPAEHIVTVAAPAGGRLSEALGEGTSSLVAVSADAVAAARENGADIRGVATLGPTERAFQRLVELGVEEHGEHLRRGAAAVDRASLTSYTLLVFVAEVDSFDGSERSRRTLPLAVRHSAQGAVSVAWESVANLEPAERPVSRPTPAARHEALAEAQRVCEREETRERQRRSEWADRHRHALDELETRWTQQIRSLDEDARREARRRFQEDKTARLRELGDLAAVSVSAPQLVGWVHVEGAGRVEELGYDPDSEQLAVATVVDELERTGFDVDDRQTAGLGYDLLAVRRRGREQRLIEVKGQLHGLSSVTLESHEWGQAMQRGGEYWLYVVTGCAEQPTVSVRLQDPAGRVSGGPTLIERFEIPASKLREHTTNDPGTGR